MLSSVLHGDLMSAQRGDLWCMLPLEIIAQLVEEVPVHLLQAF